MEHAKHIIRAVLLIICVLVVYVCVRHFMIPQSFGMHGHYRFTSVAEHASTPLVHGAPGACAECHEEEAQTVAEDLHRSVSCETCHAPLTTHIAEGEKIAPMLVQRSNSLCAYCHQFLTARPGGLPQVVFADHVTQHGEELTPEACLECHDVHKPNE